MRDTFIILFFLISVSVVGQSIENKFYCECKTQNIDNNETIYRNNCKESLNPHPTNIKNGIILIYNEADSNSICCKYIKDSVNSRITTIFYYSNNKPYHKITETRDTIYEVYYYPNGNVQESKTLLTSASYAVVGSWKFYYSDGQVKKEGIIPSIYNEQKKFTKVFGLTIKNEVWTYFYPNGQLKMKSYGDIEDTLYVQGFAYLVDYFDENNVQLVKNGNGTINIFDKNIKTLTTRTFKNGKVQD